jgi:hypothetical protein
VGILTLLLGLCPAPSQADFSSIYLRFDRMKASTASNVLVVFTPNAAGTEASVQVAFGAGTTVSGTPAVSVSGIPTGVTALPGTLSASSASQTVTVSGVTDLTPGTSYGFYLNSTVTNGTAGSYTHTVTTKTSGAVTIDSTTVAGVVVGDEQIVITAAVPPTFDFDLDGNTDSFTANLDLNSVVSTSGRLATVQTNAPGGWVIWAKSSNQGLSSAAASYTIPTTGTVNGAPSTLSTGTNGYVLDANITTDSATVGSGTVSVAGEYNGSGTNQGGTLSSTYETVAQSDGPTDGDSVTVVFRSTVGGLTPAASDYTDTITLVGAGLF